VPVKRCQNCNYVIIEASVPFCVVERPCSIEILKRASDLTKGCFWKIVCLYLLFGIVAAVFNSAVGFALNTLPGVSANELIANPN